MSEKSQENKEDKEDKGYKEDKIMRVEAALQLQFKDPSLLIQALTHKSFVFSDSNREPEAAFGHNEVLELVGDAVLDLAVTEWLIERFPLDSEGQLSKKRASLVNEFTLSAFAKELGLGEALRLGRGEQKSGGPSKDSILASAFEALVGAIFKDRSYKEAKQFLFRLYSEKLQSGNFEKIRLIDYKTKLQELLQKTGKKPPHYKLLSESGPSHAKFFRVGVFWLGEKLSEGSGSSKKQAEQRAAELALSALAESKASDRGSLYKSSSKTSGKVSGIASGKASDLKAPLKSSEVTSK